MPGRDLLGDIIVWEIESYHSYLTVDWNLCSTTQYEDKGTSSRRKIDTYIDDLQFAPRP